MLSRLFIAALWSPEGKGLTSCLLFVMFIVILLLSQLCPRTCVVLDCDRVLILVVFFTLMLNVPVNSYGHSGMVSSPKRTFFLGKLD